LRIIHTLDAIAEQVGCYKVGGLGCVRDEVDMTQTILDCSEANEGFYVKCGYKRVGVEMAHYYNKKE
jgi:glucosamine-phosphate N-acetyltransferase